MEDELLIKFLLKEANAEEEGLVHAWILESLDNQKELSRFERIWKTSKTLEAKDDTDADLAWDRFRQRVSEDRPAMGAVRKMGRSYEWLKVAAILFIAAGAWALYSILNPAYQTLEAGRMVRTEILPDGSELVLNRNTELAFKTDFKDQRIVRLKKGEVFFNVKADAAHPFIIEADDLRIQVVGTSFNVKNIEGEQEVIVESGVVKVSLADQVIELKKGEKVSVNDENSALRKEISTDQLYDYYRSNQFVAVNTPLWRVVEVLNEAYDNRIIIEDPDLRNLTLTTTFEDDSLDNIIHVITETFKINAVKQDGKIILK